MEDDDLLLSLGVTAQFADEVEKAVLDEVEAAQGEAGGAAGNDMPSDATPCSCMQLWAQVSYAAHVAAVIVIK